MRTVRANSSSGTFAAIAPRTHWWYFTAPILPTNRWFTPSRSDHFSAHQSANSGSSSSASISFVRFFGSVSARNARTSSGRRQPADGVEVCPADELLVGAEGGRLDLEQLQLGEDVRIDVVPLRRVGPAEVRASGRGTGPPPGVISPMYSAMTTTSPGFSFGHRAVRADAGGQFVVHREPRQVRDVALRAVGECRATPSASATSAGHRSIDCLRGVTASETGRGDRSRSSLGPCAIQSRSRRYEVAVGSKPPAALVRRSGPSPSQE